MDIQIRLAKTADQPQILDLQDLSLRALTAPDYTLQQIESLVQSQRAYRSSTQEFMVVAEFQDQLIGFAALMTRSPQISAMFVHPDWIRQGIGTQLLQEIEAIAIQKHYRFVSVMASLTALPFYQARGYQLLQDTGFWSSPNTWIACKSLRKELIPLSPKELWIRKVLTIAVYILILIAILRIFI
jgi:putative acetyltransferase